MPELIPHPLKNGKETVRRSDGAIWLDRSKGFDDTPGWYTKDGSRASDSEDGGLSEQLLKNGHKTVRRSDGAVWMDASKGWEKDPGWYGRDGARAVDTIGQPEQGPKSQVRDLLRIPNSAMDAVNSTYHAIGSGAKVFGQALGGVWKPVHDALPLDLQAIDPIQTTAEGAVESGQALQNLRKSASEQSQNYMKNVVGSDPNSRLSQGSEFVGEVAGGVGKAMAMGPAALSIFAGEAGVDKTSAAMDEGRSMDKAILSGGLSAGVNAAIMKMPGGEKAFQTLKGMIANKIARGTIMGTIGGLSDAGIDALILDKNISKEELSKRVFQSIKMMLGYEGAGALSSVKPIVRAKRVLGGYADAKTAVEQTGVDAANKYNEYAEALKNKSPEAGRLAEEAKAAYEKSAAAVYAERAGMKFTGGAKAGPKREPISVQPEPVAKKTMAQYADRPLNLTDAQKQELLARGFPGKGTVNTELKRTIEGSAPPPEQGPLTPEDHMARLQEGMMSPNDFVNGIDDHLPMDSGPSPDAKAHVAEVMAQNAPPAPAPEPEPIPSFSRPAVDPDAIGRGTAAHKAMEIAKGQLESIDQMHRKAVQDRAADLVLDGMKGLNPSEKNRLARAQEEMRVIEKRTNNAKRQTLKTLNEGLPVDVKTPEDLDRYMEMAQNDSDFWHAKFTKAESGMPAVAQKALQDASGDHGAAIASLHSDMASEARKNGGTVPIERANEIAESIKALMEAPDGQPEAESAPQSEAPKAETRQAEPKAPQVTADFFGGQQVYEAMMKGLGLDPKMTVPDMVSHVGRQIGELGASAKETAIKIMDKMQGIGREAAEKIAAILHDIARPDPGTRNTDIGDAEAGMIGFHGSPHNFDEFDSSHMGSGEGAQAFGWGHYFAENKGVAEAYRKNLSGGTREIVYDGEAVTRTSRPVRDEILNGDPEKIAASLVAKTMVDMGKSPVEAKDTAVKSQRQIVEGMRAHIASGRPADDAFKTMFGKNEAILDSMEKVDPAKFKDKNGQLYEVDIPEADTMLHWDKQMVDQPASVKKMLDGLPKDSAGRMIMPNGEHWDVDQRATGEDVYKAFQEGKLSDSEASKALKDEGISGIAYLDGSSRREGDGSHNYVIFDDAAIKITKKFYADMFGGQGVYEESMKKLGFDPNMPAKDFVNEVSNRIGKLGASVKETTIKIMGKVKGIARDVAERIAEVLHSMVDGSRESQLGAIGPDIKSRLSIKSETGETKRVLSENGEASVSEPKSDNTGVKPWVPPTLGEAPKADGPMSRDAVHSTINEMFPGVENKSLRKSLYDAGALVKQHATEADVKRFVTNLQKPVEEIIPEIKKTEVTTMVAKDLVKKVMDRAIAGVTGAVKAPAHGLKDLASNAIWGATKAVHAQYEKLGIIQKSYKKGSGVLPEISNSPIMGTAPKVVNDMEPPTSWLGKTGEFLQSRHNIEREAFPDGFGPTIDAQKVTTHELQMRGEFSRWASDILKKHNITDASDKIKERMAPIAKKFLDASYELKSIVDRGNALAKAGDEAGIAGHSEQSSSKVEELNVTIKKALAERDTAVKELASKYIDSRVYLAAEMPKGQIEPWLDKLMSKNEIEASDAIREGMRTFKDKLVDAGIETLGDNKEYMTHLITNLHPDHFKSIAPEGILPPDILNFHSRTAGSKTFFPSAAAVMDYYPPSVSRKLALQPFVDKWKAAIDTESLSSYANPASENYAKNTTAYVDAMLRTMQSHEKYTPLDTAIDGVRQFHRYKLLSFALSVAYKHSFKMLTMASNHHVYLLPATRDYFQAKSADIKFIDKALENLGVDRSDAHAKLELMNHFVSQKQIMAALEETSLKSAANQAVFESRMRGLLHIAKGGAVDTAGKKAFNGVKRATGAPTSWLEAFENGVDVMASLSRGHVAEIGLERSANQAILNELDYNQRGGVDASKLTKDRVGRTIFMFSQTPSKIMENYYQIAKAGFKGGKDIYGSDNTGNLVRMIAVLGAAKMAGDKMGLNVMDSIFHLPFVNTKWWGHLGKAVAHRIAGNDADADQETAQIVADKKGPLLTSPVLETGKDLKTLLVNPSKLITDTTAFKQGKALVTGEPPDGYTSLLDYVSKSKDEDEKDQQDFRAQKRGLREMKSMRKQ